MKTILVALTLGAILGGALVGCSDTSAPITAPSDQTVAIQSTITSLAKTDCIGYHSVVGNAYFRTIPLTGETNEHLVFGATRSRNGKLSGEVHLKDDGPQVIFDGYAIDLKVVGNKAKICYTITKGTWALGTPPMDIKGFFVCLVAIDNGSGRHGGNDEVSLCAVTDGSDIVPMTIKGVTDMSPDDYVKWALGYFGVTHLQFFPILERGRVEIR